MSVLQKVKSYTYFISETTQPQFVYVDCAFNKSILPKNLQDKIGNKEPNICNIDLEANFGFNGLKFFDENHYLDGAGWFKECDHL